MKKTDKKRHTARTDRARARARKRFLKALAETGNISEACRLAPLGRQTAYEWRDSMPDFAKGWNEALEVAIDALEREARRRAVDGVAEPVYQGGKKVGTIKRYSDRMLELLLKGHRPQKYRERVELGVGPGAPVGELRDATRAMGMARRVSYVLAMGAMAMGKRTAEGSAKAAALLPAPAPNPKYRDRTPSDEIRGAHPGASDEPRVERELNPIGGRRTESGEPVWNPGASREEMGRDE